MKNLERLERALAFDMIVASRALLLTRLGKENPNLPAELFYSPDELEVLEVKKSDAGKYATAAKLTLLQANILVAMLAGFWARPSDGHPGAQILAEGLRELHAMVWYKVHSAQQVPPPPKRRKPT